MSSKFSDRIGITKPPTHIQINNMSDELQNSIWNVFLIFLGDYSDKEGNWIRAAEMIGRNIFKVPVDSIPNRNQEFNSYIWVREQYFNRSWHEKYNILEHVIDNMSYITQGRYDPQDSTSLVNSVLERELSGYRFIEGILTPISNPQEVLAIEEAISGSKKKGLNGVHEHLNQSLRCLGQKPDPDYRNAIKEAISGIESAVVSLVGSSGHDFEKAIKELSKKILLHGALQAAFTKLYGYTSDEDGIRHAILENKDIDYDDAKFMVVVCSAFVNYLLCRAEKEGLIK